MELIGISEKRWTGNGKIKLATGEIIIYSGNQQENAVNSKGVAFLMSGKATKALIAWEPTSKKLLKIDFNQNLIIQQLPTFMPQRMMQNVK
jgi:hypothetical protein